MPRITAVKKQKKSNRLNVYLDDRFAFGIERNIWLQKGYSVGDSINEADIPPIKKESEAALIYDKLLNFISFRPRSEKEVQQKLLEISRKQDISKQRQEEFIEKLKSASYIDDEAFARWWAEQRKIRLKGKKIVAAELYQKGINSALIQKVLSEEPVAGEDEARRLLFKNQWRYSKLEGMKKKAKMQQMLLRHGFSYDEAQSAISDFLETETEESD